MATHHPTFRSTSSPSSSRTGSPGALLYSPLPPPPTLPSASSASFTMPPPSSESSHQMIVVGRRESRGDCENNGGEVHLSQADSCYLTHLQDALSRESNHAVQSESMLLDKDAELTVLKEQHNEVVEALTSTQFELDRARRKVVERDRTIDMLEENLKNARENEREMRERAETAEAKERVAKGEAQLAHAQVVTLNASSSHEHHELTESETRCSALEVQHRLLKEHLNNTRNELVAARRQVENQKCHLIEWTARGQAMQTELHQNKEKIERLKHELEECVKAKEEVNRAHRVAANDVVGLEIENTSLTTQVEKLRNELDVAETLLRTAREQKDSLETEKCVLNSKLNSVEEYITSLLDEKKSLSSQLEEREYTLSNRESRITTLLQDIEVLHSVRDSLATTLSQQEERHRIFAVTSERREKEEIEAALARVASLEKQVEQLAGDLEESTTARSIEKLNYDMRLEAARRQIEGLSERLHAPDNQTENDNNNSSSDNRCVMCATLQAVCDKKHDTIVAHLKDTRCEITRLKRQLEDKSAVATERDAVAIDVQELRAEVRALRETVSRKSDEVSTLEWKLEQLEGAKAHLERRAQELEIEVNGQRQRYEVAHDAHLAGSAEMTRLFGALRDRDSVIVELKGLLSQTAEDLQTVHVVLARAEEWKDSLEMTRSELIATKKSLDDTREALQKEREEKQDLEHTYETLVREHKRVLVDADTLKTEVVVARRREGCAAAALEAEHERAQLTRDVQIWERELSLRQQERQLQQFDNNNNNNTSGSSSPSPVPPLPSTRTVLRTSL